MKTSEFKPHVNFYLHPTCTHNPAVPINNLNAVVLPQHHEQLLFQRFQQLLN